jgi:toxin CcdB
MAQFDVYEYRGPAKSVAYLLDIQSDLLRDLASRVVVPLISTTDFGPPLGKLTPVLSINGVPYVMATTDIAGTPVRNLGRVVGNLEDHRLDIKGAIDFLFDGH